MKAPGWLLLARQLAKCKAATFCLILVHTRGVQASAVRCSEKSKSQFSTELTESAQSAKLELGLHGFELGREPGTVPSAFRPSCDGRGTGTRRTRRSCVQLNACPSVHGVLVHSSVMQSSAGDSVEVACKVYTSGLEQKGLHIWLVQGS
jgi:hypothetical protein